MSTAINKSFPDCSVCRLPKNKTRRERWGCDAPVTVTVFKIGCACGGEVDCAKCKGLGVIDMHRCPNSIVADGDRVEVQRVATFLRTYAEYDARNVLPAPGGFGDQAASWCEAVQVADQERGRWEKIRHEAMAKEARKGA